MRPAEAHSLVFVANITFSLLKQAQTGAVFLYCDLTQKYDRECFLDSKHLLHGYLKGIEKFKQDECLLTCTSGCFADNQSGMEWSLRSSQNVWDLSHADYVVRIGMERCNVRETCCLYWWESHPARGLK